MYVRLTPAPGEKPRPRFGGELHLMQASLLEAPPRSFLSVEVVLSRAARLQLPALAYLKALGE